MSFTLPEQYRRHDLERRAYGTIGNEGNGMFVLPSPIARRVLLCVVSNGSGWEHVSVSARQGKPEGKTRLPTWDEMCLVKASFWGEDDNVVQFHPPESAYVDYAQVLHLWRPVGWDIPWPDPALVGAL